MHYVVLLASLLFTSCAHGNAEPAPQGETPAAASAPATPHEDVEFNKSVSDLSDSVLRLSQAVGKKIEKGYTKASSGTSAEVEAAHKRLQKAAADFDVAAKEAAEKGKTFVSPAIKNLEEAFEDMAEALEKND